jgi:hypothetical protein
VGYSEAHIGAFKRWQKDGSLSISEDTVRLIEREDPEQGRSIREDRERHERTVAERQPQAPVPPRPRLAVPHKGEGWDQFVSRAKGDVVPVALLAGMWDTVLSILKPLDARLKAIESTKMERVRSLDADPEGDGERLSLEQRIAALEQRPTLEYRGTWERGAMYAAGNVVTHHGSAWVSRVNELRSEPGADFIGWQMIVKRGRDGRVPR